jgi:hypothetical protein
MCHFNLIATNTLKHRSQATDWFKVGITFIQLQSQKFLQSGSSFKAFNGFKKPSIYPCAPEERKVTRLLDAVAGVWVHLIVELPRSAFKMLAVPMPQFQKTLDQAINYKLRIKEIIH